MNRYSSSNTNSNTSVVEDNSEVFYLLFVYLITLLSKSDYVQLNERLKCIMNRNGSGPIWGTILAFSWRAEVIHTKMEEFSLSLLLLLPLWSIWHPWNALFLFSFLILRGSVGLFGRGINLSQGRYLHRTTQTQNKRRQVSMPLVGFEPTIPAFERAKIVHVLDRAATVIGKREELVL
jgi:hypothetical protein